MIRYLLDTDISSFFLKRRLPQLRERITAAMRRGEVGVSVITRAELRYGLALLPEARRLHHLVDEFLRNIPIFPWDNKAADQYAKLAATQKQRGQPIGILDTQIAAHAIAENLILVTNNERDFGRISGLKIDNWLQ